MKTLIIVPAYNEGENIERVINNLKDNFPQYDYIVINDGSRDNTEQICREKGFNFISHPVNLGLAGAVQTGMKYAYKHGYDAAVQYDGDGQHDARFISPMLEELKAGNDVVIGSRFVTEKKPHSLRMLGSNMIQFAIRLTTGKTIKDPTSGMRMYNKKLIEKLAFALDLGPEPDTVALFIRKKFKVKEIQVEMLERIAGESYLNFSRSIKYMMRMFVSILILQWFREV